MLITTTRNDEHGIVVVMDRKQAQNIVYEHVVRAAGSGRRHACATSSVGNRTEQSVGGSLLPVLDHAGGHGEGHGVGALRAQGLNSAQVQEMLLSTLCD